MQHKTYNTSEQSIKMYFKVLKVKHYGDCNWIHNHLWVVGINIIITVWTEVGA